MMARAKTVVQFDPKYFDELMKSARVSDFTKDIADGVLAEAQAKAPVDSGDYKNGLMLIKRVSKHRTVWRVVGTNWKTLLVESKTGNLVRALRAAKK